MARYSLTLHQHGPESRHYGTDRAVYEESSDDLPALFEHALMFVKSECFVHLFDSVTESSVFADNEHAGCFS